VTPAIQPQVIAKVYNRRTQLLCPPEILERLKELLRYHPPNYRFMPLYKEGIYDENGTFVRVWDGYINCIHRGTVATGLFLDKHPEIERMFPLLVDDRRTLPTFREISIDGARPFQLEAVSAMQAASNTGGLIVSATGSGKTLIAGMYFKRLVGTACFVVDELSLLAQSKDALEKFLGERVGIVGKSLFEPKRITCATIQTLHRHRNNAHFKRWMRSLEVIIIDEVHVAINKRNIDVVRMVKPKAVFGLTATLELQKEHIYFPVVALTGPVIYRYSITKGVEQGYLSEGVACCVEYRDRLQGIAPCYTATVREKGVTKSVVIAAGSPAAEYRYRIVLNKERNDCIEALVRAGLEHKRKIVLLLEQKAHIRVLAKRLHDVPHAIASGSVDTEDRRKAMRLMDAGKLDLIIASRVFGKGVDVAAVDMIVDGTALTSRNNSIQRYGRGVRLQQGKNGLLYFDIQDSGNLFQDAAYNRRAALHTVATATLDCVWRRNASKIIQRALQALSRID